MLREPKWGDAASQRPMSKEEYGEAYGYEPCDDEYREYYENEIDRYF